MNTLDFDLLGETVTVTTNPLGTMLYVTYGDKEIANLFGACISWPYMGNLHGAARKSLETKILREAAEAEIRQFLLTAGYNHD